MSRLTRDGTAEPVSRDQILRHLRGPGNIIFPVQLTTSRIGSLTRLIHTLLYADDHTYIYIHLGRENETVRMGGYLTNQTTDNQRVRNQFSLTRLCQYKTVVFVYFQVNNGVVYLDYEDSHHRGPLLCSFQLLYRICLYCLMMYWFVFPFVGVPAWRLK